MAARLLQLCGVELQAAPDGVQIAAALGTRAGCLGTARPAARLPRRRGSGGGGGVRAEDLAKPREDRRRARRCGGRGGLRGDAVGAVGPHCNDEEDVVLGWMDTQEGGRLCHLAGVGTGKMEGT